MEANWLDLLSEHAALQANLNTPVKSRHAPSPGLAALAWWAAAEREAWPEAREAWTEAWAAAEREAEPPAEREAEPAQPLASTVAKPSAVHSPLSALVAAAREAGDADAWVSGPASGPTTSVWAAASSIKSGVWTFPQRGELFRPPRAGVWTRLPGGELVELVDEQLWAGAHAAGWRIRERCDPASLEAAA